MKNLGIYVKMLFLIMLYKLCYRLLKFSHCHLRFLNKGRPSLISIEDPQVWFEELPFDF